MDTGETKQVTDGLADAMYPVCDASGKYLWFLASTDFGLRSQWLDMTSYDREETFGLYLAVLKKGEPSPLLPESDEEGGRLRGPRAGSGRRGAEQAEPAARGGRRAGGTGGRREAGAAAPVTVQIDFDGLQQRIVAMSGVPGAAVRAAAAGRGRHACSTSRRRPVAAPGGGSTLHRYRLSDRKAAAFAPGRGGVSP